MLFPLLSYSQNLTGVWEGEGGGVTYIKLVVSHKGKKVVGYTSDKGGGYCTASFSGVYNKETRKLTGLNIQMIENSGTHGPARYNWTYSKEADGEYLRENSTSLLEKILGIDSDQWLKRVSRKPELLKTTEPAVVKEDVQKQTPPVKTKTPVKPAIKTNVLPKEKDKITGIITTRPIVNTQPKPIETPEKYDPEILKIKQQRNSKFIQTIKTREDSIRILLYDNGIIDNDTVTVFYNNKVILEKYMITDQAKELKIPVNRNSKNIIELFADNLGTIPPNTALLIIYAGQKRYELHASYDLNNNAGIIIEYDPNY